MIKEAVQGIVESEFLSGAFLLSVFAGIILALKSFGKIIYNRIRRKVVYSVQIEQTDELFRYMERWFKAHYENQYRNVIAHLKEIYIPFDSPPTDDDESQTDDLRYRQRDDTVFIKYRGSYIKIFKGREKLENANSLRSLYFDNFTLEIIFFKSKIHKLLNEVVEYNQKFKVKTDKREIFTWDGYNWEKLTDVKMKTIDQVIIKESIKKSLVKDIDRFIQREQWYAEKSIPYKRGYLFYGSPGNGKTSLSSAIAHYLNRSICTVTLSEIKDDGFMRDIFSKTKSDSILLFEDVDTMFTKRKSKNKLTFSTFLNCLDGVFYKHGIIVIMTTNHVEKLDPALIRPGRIDFQINIDNPEFEEVKSYIELFFEKSVDISKNGYKPHLQMSEIQNICMGNDKNSVINKIFNL